MGFNDPQKNRELKTVLIVAPHFPPSAMPPSQRVRLLVTHFRDLGWNPVVITVDHYYREEASDPWMVELAGNKFDLVITKCLDQRKTRKFKIGDIGLRMMPYLYSTIKKTAKEYKADFVLYPVPAWYTMIVAPFIKRKTGIPYGIDFIDPWARKTVKPGFKARMSQYVAKALEGFVVKRSSLIIAVSQGILNDLIERYPVIADKNMAALPYGVELGDYRAVRASGTETPKATKLVRYIGALSESMEPVADALLQALVLANKQEPLKVEFIGTSYAGSGLAQPRIRQLIEKAKAEDFITEIPDRVTYRRALELTMEADILLIIGDLTPYYAASKLMGMIASGRPFFAFLQKDSFPAAFLRELNYPYVVEYTAVEGNMPADRTDAAREKFLQMVKELPDFEPVPEDHPAFQQQTARGMTQKFVESIQKSIHDQTTLR